MAFRQKNLTREGAEAKHGQLFLLLRKQPVVFHFSGTQTHDFRDFAKSKSGRPSGLDKVNRPR